MLTRAQMLTADLVWLVSIDYAGRLWRWSTEPVTVTDGDGRALAFDGGLAALDVAEVLAVLADTPDLLSVALELLWPDDVALLVAQGHDLATATGELAAWSRGTVYEDRAVLIDGRVLLPQYGADGEPVQLSIEEKPYEDRALYPPQGNIVKTTTTATGSTIEEEGFTYPLIWGGVGQLDHLDGTITDVRGSPAVVVAVNASSENTEIMICGEEIEATTATIWAQISDAWVSEDLAVHYKTVNNHRTARVDLTTATTIGLMAAPKYYVSLSSGGTLNHGSSGPIKGLGDLAIWWLARSTLRIDWPRWYAIKNRLNVWDTAGYVDSEVAPWKWLTDNLLPLVPITVHSGAAGIYPIWWEYNATAEKAIQHIEVEPGVARVGLVEYDRAPSQITNNLEIKYAPAADSGDYKGSARIATGVDLDGADNQQHGTLHAEASALRYGMSALETMTTDILYSEAAAALTLRWRVLAESRAHRLIRYEVPQSYLWLEMGAIVTLTDAELHMANVVALVVGRTLTDNGRGQIDLQVITDPARVTVTTGATGWPPNDTPEVT